MIVWDLNEMKFRVFLDALCNVENDLNGKAVVCNISVHMRRPTVVWNRFKLRRRC